MMRNLREEEGKSHACAPAQGTDKEASAADREKKIKQEAMNKRAYETCAPVWRGVLERAP